MDAVHIGGVGVAVVEIEHDVLHRKIRHGVERHGEIDGVLQRQRREAQAAHAVKNHADAGVARRLIHMGLQRIGILPAVVEVPHAAHDLDVPAHFPVGKLVDEVKQLLAHALGAVAGQLVLHHIAVGTVRQTDAGIARQYEAEIRGKLKRTRDQIMIGGRGERHLARAAVDHLLNGIGIVVNTVAVQRVFCHISSLSLP